MPSTIAIVQARLGSRRLKAKVARRLGGRSVLEWVVRRVSECQSVSCVVVATSDEPQDKEIRRLVPSDIAVYTGSETDVLGRFAAVVRELEPDAVVRVCADNPFIDPTLIDDLIRAADEHTGADYVGYEARDGRPAILGSIGLFAEWCRASALLHADVEAEASADREHVTRYLYTNTDRFKVRLIRAPEAIDRGDLRLTLDFEQDWEHAETIFDALGPENLNWRAIASLLEAQPALRSQMERMNLAHVKT